MYFHRSINKLVVISQLLYNTVSWALASVTKFYNVKTSARFILMTRECNSKLTIKNPQRTYGLSIRLRNNTYKSLV